VIADVYERTEAYIIKTNGQWPRSWDDLGLTEDEVLWVMQMDFTLDPDTASMEDVAKAIKPRNEPNDTFWPVRVAPPQQGIDRVYSAMCKARDKKP
jgi:hypothetical protein